MLNLHLQKRILRFRGLALDVLQFWTVLFWTGCLCGAVIREECIDERKTSTDSWTEAKGVNPSEVWSGTARFQILRTRRPEGHKRHLLVGRQIPCLIHQHFDVSEVQGIASHCSDFINLALVNLISSLLIEAWEEIFMAMHEISSTWRVTSSRNSTSSRRWRTCWCTTNQQRVFFNEPKRCTRLNMMVKNTSEAFETEKLTAPGRKD